MSKIDRTHPKFDDVLDLAIKEMGDVAIDNIEAFKADVECIELVDGRLVLHLSVAAQADMEQA